MNRYAQFCPIAKASEILTRRWMPLVVRELLCGSSRFNEIHRGVPKMSRSLLVTRLRDLEHASLLDRTMVGDNAHPEYHLTDAGAALRPVIQQMGEWGKRWVGDELSEDDVDAGLLMWDIQRRIEQESVPDRRVVVYFHFPDAHRDHKDFWLLLEAGRADLCLKHPGYEENVYIRADVETLTRVWLGDIGLRRAIKRDAVWIGGPKHLRQQIPEWLGLSMFAGIPRSDVPEKDAHAS